MLCDHNLPISAKCRRCFDEGMAREAEAVTKGHKPKSRKAKTCRVCKQKFIPRRDMQSCCGYPAECEAIKADRAVAKNAAKREMADRKRTREKLDAMATMPQLKEKAQKAFNAFIRTRDRLAGHGDISSDRPLDWSGNKTDAGHFRSVGAAPHLRYNEDNCHAQSKHDNKYKAGNVGEYRIRLIDRIGIDRVLALEANNEPRHYTREDLIELAAHYRQKTRELMK